jgi:hypothetical protein
MFISQSVKLDGIPSLIKLWRDIRVPLEGQSIKTQTGTLTLTGFDAELSEGNCDDDVRFRPRYT